MKRYVAVAALAAALGSGAAQAQTYFQLMDGCRDMTKPAEARLSACNGALEKAQPDATADRAIIHLYRSDAKIGVGKYDEAIVDSDGAITGMERYQPGQNARCWARAVANKDLDVAGQACAIALNIDDNQGYVHDTAGVLALRLGNWDEAYEHFRRAYAIDKTLVSSLYGRGLASLALGKTAEGEADLKVASAAAADFNRYGMTLEAIKKHAAEKPPKPAAN